MGNLILILKYLDTDWDEGNPSTDKLMQACLQTSKKDVIKLEY
jgi:hypothetical protein